MKIHDKRKKINFEAVQIGDVIVSDGNHWQICRFGKKFTLYNLLNCQISMPWIEHDTFETPQELINDLLHNDWVISEIIPREQVTLVIDEKE